MTRKSKKIIKKKIQVLYYDLLERAIYTSSELFHIYAYENKDIEYIINKISNISTELIKIIKEDKSIRVSDVSVIFRNFNFITSDLLTFEYKSEDDYRKLCDAISTNTEKLYSSIKDVKFVEGSDVIKTTTIII